MKRLALTPLFLALLGACSARPADEPAAQPSVEPAAASGEASGIASEDAAAATKPGPVSRYTSLKGCKVVRSGEGEGEDWSESACPGTGRWSLKIYYGDAREGMELIGPGPKRVTGEPVTSYLIPAGVGFNAFGETVEWRGRGVDDAFEPTALIVRNSVTVDGATGRQESQLLVADLSQRCLVAKVQPGSGQNEKARKVADDPLRKCLPLERP